MVLVQLCLNTRLWRVMAFLALALLLYVGLRDQPVPMYTTNFDKWAHCVGFGLLVIAFGLAFRRLHSLWLLLGMTLLGYLIELAQNQWLPMRSFSLGDLLADVVGVVIALIVLWPVREYLRKKDV